MEAYETKEMAERDSAWENVMIPHDYSIDRGFFTAAPAEQESGCEPDGNPQKYKKGEKKK